MRQRGAAERARKEEELRLRRWTPRYTPPPPRMDATCYGQWNVRVARFSHSLVTQSSRSRNALLLAQ